MRTARRRFDVPLSMSTSVHPWPILLCTLLVRAAGVHPDTTAYLHFSGDGQYVEMAAAPDLSVGPDGFTISAWLKPDALEFARTEGSGYIYWMGKGEKTRYEWAARM